MWTDLMLMDFAYKNCFVVDLDSSATIEGFNDYDFTSR